MPTPTVADFRGLLYRRVGEYAALADLDDAMARAARQASLSPAAATGLADADLATLAQADRDGFLDVAELRAWESILGNATEPGLRDAGLDESPSYVRDLAREKIKSLAALVKSVQGVGLPTISLGTIGLNFAAGAESDSSSAEW